MLRVFASMARLYEKRAISSMKRFAFVSVCALCVFFVWFVFLCLCLERTLRQLFYSSIMLRVFKRTCYPRRGVPRTVSGRSLATLAEEQRATTEGLGPRGLGSRGHNSGPQLRVGVYVTPS
jgi:hypothetical protein